MRPLISAEHCGATGFESMAILEKLPLLGFGAFKIGRNQKIKYPSTYDLPDEARASEILNGVLDLGITLIDTAPAYGLSEERIGRHLASRRNEFLLSTKVGEWFENGESTYRFDEASIRASVERSLSRLRTDVIDCLFAHVPANDVEVLRDTPWSKRCWRSVPRERRGRSVSRGKPPLEANWRWNGRTR